MAMALLKFILIVAITMAFSITLMMKGIDQDDDEGTTSSSVNVNPKSSSPYDHMNKEESLMMNYQQKQVTGSKRKSRFLAGKERNPRAADHCQNDDEGCYLYDEEFGKNSTCCNNKCVDLSTDDKNCGACKKKCKYTESCCRGECVNLSYDKRNCGYCSHGCSKGEFCVYGLCNYP